MAWTVLPSLAQGNAQCNWPFTICTSTSENMPMTFPRISSMCAASLLVLCGCGTTVTQQGIEQRTSQAIGREVGTFTISDQQKEEGSNGRINYRVRTREGASYSCYMYSPSQFTKAMTFGQTPQSDAICTAMAGQGGGGAATAAPAPASCNALLRAAKRC